MQINKIGCVHKPGLDSVSICLTESSVTGPSMSAPTDNSKTKQETN